MSDEPNPDQRQQLTVVFCLWFVGAVAMVGGAGGLGGIPGAILAAGVALTVLAGFLLFGFE